ncbi:CaiB/BaiF CoA transferase family protein [Hyphococcus luteus]|uniref:Carnitine dehydratase n=1 Tax=Hyphococcus luteus TaxID=2058213 RepID=A0A2S7K4F3_9PROT|nr:CaiB/BaiF CoA-transferase family protein [Marinicaulis flavus]PQA87385.1 carnitine dehydratase [Marinicaulis flavus]
MAVDEGVSGPLKGVRIIEIASLAPGPFCAMMLADMGAEVIRIDRTQASDESPPLDYDKNILNRNRRSVALDLKNSAAVDVILDLCRRADGLIEGFRPGVMERLGLGPSQCMAANEALVYGRITGWGQDGPLAQTAGHDINYIALTGALHATGPAERPVPPLNLVGDFAGGGMLLAFGLVCALFEANRSGKGQIVDAAMIDGAAVNMALTYSMFNAGLWRDRREANLVDGGAPFYRVYKTSDDRFVCVGAIEPKFYFNFIGVLGLSDEALFASPNNPANWPEMIDRLDAIFATRTRAEWEQAFEGAEACFAAVHTLAEAPGAPHNAHRGTFARTDDLVQPSPAPRFSRTPGAINHGPRILGADTRSVLSAWGVSDEEINRLIESGAAVQS